MKLIRNQSTVIVVMDNGAVLQSTRCTDEMFEMLKVATPEEAILIINPTRKNAIEEAEKAKGIIDNTNKSNILSFEGSSIYWKNVSPLSMPKELAERVINAENNNDTDALESYKNFWTLLSLNPDPLCRENLFKFLNKWGMVISKSGLFVGYRNADKPYIYDEEEKEDVYTDHHSHTFRIKIGEMVTMPREECDSDSHVSCSRGLHIGGTSWLNQGYYGGVGLVCLVNPVDVVAVPFDDETYGKLRCCAYLPIDKAEYNSYGKIIPYVSNDGFEAPYIKTILYEGIMSKEDNPKYVINIPYIEGISTTTVTDNIISIAKKYMK